MKKIFIYIFISFIYSINFNDDIAPIIYNNCTECHRPNEIGAFLPFENYSDVYNNRYLIAYAISYDDRHGEPLMPPWPPDREYSTLLDERYLTDEEIQLVLDWIDEDASEGNQPEYPIPEFPDGSTIGNPDIILEMEEPYFIAGDYQDKYRCYVLPLNNDEEISMSAIEFRPGNREAVHHAIITYVPAGTADYLDNQDPGYGYECYGGFNLPYETDLIGGYAPGVTSVEYPEDIGRTLPANSDIIVQLHYAPLLNDAEDISSINIFFKDIAIEREISQYIWSDWKFALAPDQETTITNELYIENDVSLVNILPHSHLIGKSWEIFATTLENEIIPIIQIKNWDFDWQSFYYPEYLLKIPAGSTITATAVYDNTSSNTNNPNDPPAWVFPGDGTTDEMFFIPMEFISYQEGDEEIYLGNIDQCQLNGDSNQDQNLNILDVVLLVNAILYQIEQPCSDLNQDNTLNISDVVILINMILE
jgi:hypothetical protein